MCFEDFLKGEELFFCYMVDWQLGDLCRWKEASNKAIRMGAGKLVVWELCNSLCLKWVMMRLLENKMVS